MLTEIERQQSLLTLVRAVLPTDIAAQTRYCLIKNSVLLIYASSSAWATPLRFYSRQIQAEVQRKHGIKIEKVQLRILQTETGREKTKCRTALKIPAQEFIKQLRYCAESEADSQLKTALLKLTATLEKNYEATARD